MDALADACPCSVDDVLPCDTAAGAVRRKRIEIRRIRILAKSGDGLLKRSRIQQLRDPSSNKKSKDTDFISNEADDLTNNNNNNNSFNINSSMDSSQRADDLPLLLTSSCSSSEDLQAELSCSSAGRDGCPPYGTVSVCGRRREMEDAVAVHSAFSTLPCSLGGCSFCSGASASSYHFFGVYDGHGGSQAASFCQQRLHRVLADEMNLLSRSRLCPGDPAKFWQDVMTSCFLKVDEQVRRSSCSGDDCPNCQGSGCEIRIPETVGSTAIVGVVGSSHIVIANCGDCRAVISRGGKAIQLSTDHKPNKPEEMERIEAAGGQVINWDVPRILGILAMSRSIGDQFMTPFLIANPEVICIPRSESDECLILASDGLWDKVSNEHACELARRCIAGRKLRRSAAASAASTTTTSVAPDQSNDQQQQQQQQDDDSPCGTAASLLLRVALHNGSKDNISVVVVDLKRHKEAAAATTTAAASVAPTPPA